MFERMNTWRVCCDSMFTEKQSRSQLSLAHRNADKSTLLRKHVHCPTHFNLHCLQPGNSPSSACFLFFGLNEPNVHGDIQTNCSQRSPSIEIKLSGILRQLEGAVEHFNRKHDVLLLLKHVISAADIGDKWSSQEAQQFIALVATQPRVEFLAVFSEYFFHYNHLHSNETDCNETVKHCLELHNFPIMDEISSNIAQQINFRLGLLTLWVLNKFCYFVPSTEYVYIQAFAG